MWMMRLLLEMHMQQQDEDENWSQGGCECRMMFAHVKRQTKAGLPVHLSMI
jgi:hypothetical protein